jgi:thiamine-monophosphate kinase
MTSKKVNEIGEKKIIEEILKPILGNVIGDDCAVIDLGKDYLVATIDKIPEKPLAFEIGLMNYYDLGYYLAVANLSDVASMGAKPLGFIAATTFPSDFEISNLEGIIRGIKKACEDHNTFYLGGDTGESSVMSLIGAAFGIVEKDKILNRYGQNVGDIVFTTGYIGLFSTALVYYLKAKPDGLNLTEKEEELLKNKLVHPKAKFEEAYTLSELKSCTSCMDITDGFSMSLYELMKINNKGVILNLDSLPIHEITYKVADYLQVEPINIAFGPGADYELIGTISRKSMEKVKRTFKNRNMKIYFIGEIIEEQKCLLKKNEKYEEMPIRGWQHFIGNAKKVVMDYTLGGGKK